MMGMTIDQNNQATPVFAPNFNNPATLLHACPAYHSTPLLEVEGLTDFSVRVKDETQRMNLGSFKALGGVYAVFMLIAEQWKRQTGRQLKASDFMAPEIRSFAQSQVFVCASAGNHGLAVAAGARLLGATARIYLSEKVPSSFEQRLCTCSADVVRSGSTYEDSFRAAIADSQETGATLLADSSWSGYTRPPSLVMEGYTVIAEELRQEFNQSNAWPTHVFLQAGVGGLAASIAYMIRHNWTVQPHIVIVEPEAAPCLQASHKAGFPVTVTGPASTMGRLDCKEPSILAFAALEQAGVEYCVISDQLALHASGLLKAKGLPTTASGAAGFAALMSMKETLNDSSKPLVIVTEGAL